MEVVGDTREKGNGSKDKMVVGVRKWQGKRNKGTSVKRRALLLCFCLFVFSD